VQEKSTITGSQKIYFYLLYVIYFYLNPIYLLKSTFFYIGYLLFESRFSNLKNLNI